MVLWRQIITYFMWYKDGQGAPRFELGTSWSIKWAASLLHPAAPCFTLARPQNYTTAMFAFLFYYYGYHHLTKTHTHTGILILGLCVILESQKLMSEFEIYKKVCVCVCCVCNEWGEVAAGSGPCEVTELDGGGCYQLCALWCLLSCLPVCLFHCSQMFVVSSLVFSSRGPWTHL